MGGRFLVLVSSGAKYHVGVGSSSKKIAGTIVHHDEGFFLRRRYIMYHLQIFTVADIRIHQIIGTGKFCHGHRYPHSLLDHYSISYMT